MIDDSNLDLSLNNRGRDRMRLQIDVAKMTVKADAAKPVVTRSVEQNASKASVGIFECDRLHRLDIAARCDNSCSGVDKLAEMTDIVISQSINYLVTLGNAIYGRVG